MKSYVSRIIILMMTLPLSLAIMRHDNSHNITKRAVTGAHILTDAQRNKILDKHNELRREVKPVASNMLKMKWNNELETLATDYSRRCLFEHNKNRQVTGMGYIGENLYISTSSKITDDFGAGAVIEWDDEKKYYDFATQTCQSKKVCGHYTQTAWAKSEFVGCGMSTCDAVNVFGETWNGATVVVCNYSPGGNVYGTQIYAEGGPCSKCPDGYWCDDWLCSNSSVKEAKNTPMLTQFLIFIFTWYGISL